jgi:hypothetical protein
VKIHQNTMSRTIDISLDVIREMYSRMPSSKIAAELGVGKTTIKRRLKALGISRATGGVAKGTPGALSVMESFESFFDKGNPDECWPWNGGRYPQGYGSFGYSGYDGKKSRNARAHRMSYELYKGSIPDGMEVCHSCDNPPCVNPNHLWLGTRQQNAIDASQKGRLPGNGLFGEKQSRAILTEAIVLSLRSRHANGGITFTKLAREFGVTPVAIRSAVIGKTWSHIK